MIGNLRDPTSLRHPVLMFICLTPLKHICNKKYRSFLPNSLFYRTLLPNIVSFIGFPLIAMWIFICLTSLKHICNNLKRRHDLCASHAISSSITMHWYAWPWIYATVELPDWCALRYITVVYCCTSLVCTTVHHWCALRYITDAHNCTSLSRTTSFRDRCSLLPLIERWGAGVETQKNVRGEIGGWGRVPFNEPYAPSLSTIYDGA